MGRARLIFVETGLGSQVVVSIELPAAYDPLRALGMTSALRNLIHYINGGSRMTEVDSSSEAGAVQSVRETETSSPGTTYLIFEGEHSQSDDGVREVGSVLAANPEAAIEQFAHSNSTAEGVFLRAVAQRYWPKKASEIKYERRVVLS